MYQRRPPGIQLDSDGYENTQRNQALPTPGPTPEAVGANVVGTILRTDIGVGGVEGAERVAIRVQFPQNHPEILSACRPKDPQNPQVMMFVLSVPKETGRKLIELFHQQIEDALGFLDGQPR